MISRTGQRLYVRAKERIPGGTQLLSKRPELHLPEQWPSYYSRACGVEIWDLDGNKYLDMSYNGIGACTFGAADPDVNAAVCAAVEAGSMSTLNAPEEVELADVLCELHPWADMARFARGGGDAMTVAVRIARREPGADRIAFCGYHGWHDWYLAANLGGEDALDGHLLPGLEPAGVPRALRGTSLPFRYNRIAELEAIVAQHRDELAAIVMEPIRDAEPENGFLQRVREIATEIGAVLVIDEVSAGFRLTTGGAHLVYGVDHGMVVRVEDVLFEFGVAGNVDLADAVVGDVFEVIVGVEVVVFGRDVDVVDVEEDAAVGAFDDFGEELPFGHFGLVEFGVGGDVFDADGGFEEVAGGLDPGGSFAGGFEGVGHGEEVVGVGAVYGAPAEVIGEEGGFGAFDEGFEAEEVLAVGGCDGAEIHGDAVLNDAVLLEDGVEDFEGSAAVHHVVFGDDFEPVAGWFLGEDVGVVWDAQADADAEVGEVVESVCGHYWLR